MRPKILVIRGGAIGDFILTLPVLAALRETFPQASLEVLGYRHIAKLAQGAGLADEIHALDARGMASFFARNGELDAAFSDLFSGFGLVVSYLYDPDAIFSDNLRRCSRAQLITGAHRPDEKGSAHAADVFLSALERLAIFDFDPTPRMVLGADLADRLAGAWWAFHPGSGSQKKNWPLACWAALLQRFVSETAMKVLLVGGEGEEGTLEKLEAALPPDRVRLARGEPLWVLGARLQQCQGFVGHDSGITHLAAALGLPGIALWGPTAAHIWRPLSPRFSLLSHPSGLARLPPEEVFEALRAMNGE